MSEYRWQCLVCKFFGKDTFKLQQKILLIMMCAQRIKIIQTTQWKGRLSDEK